MCMSHFREIIGLDCTCRPLNHRDSPIDMPRHKPHPAPTSQLRRHIASAAARLMAEDGIADYGAAKRKAARQLGAGTADGLPSNEEVEQELRDYQAIYQDDEHAEHLQELRQAALGVMEHLRDFRPCLTGAVLDGTAGRYAAIELDVFADSSKDVEIMLLSSGIQYEVDDIPRRGHDPVETRLRLDWEGIPVHLLIYPAIEARNQSRNSHTGRTRQRAQAGAVAALIESARS